MSNNDSPTDERNFYQNAMPDGHDPNELHPFWSWVVKHQRATQDTDAAGRHMVQWAKENGLDVFEPINERTYRHYLDAAAAAERHGRYTTNRVELAPDYYGGDIAEWNASQNYNASAFRRTAFGCILAVGLFAFAALAIAAVAF